jgi:(p)ppGpp synthase/HD superfamily hydrolase
VNLDLLRAFATGAHAGQIDRDGVPHIEHVIEVEAACLEFRDRAVAFLHDVLEDSDATDDDLRRVGASEAVIADVHTLTRLKSETYEDYIARVVAEGSASARRVKIEDIRHNLARSRKAGIASLVVRYERAARELGVETRA